MTYRGKKSAVVAIACGCGVASAILISSLMNDLALSVIVPLGVAAIAWVFLWNRWIIPRDEPLMSVPEAAETLGMPKSKVEFLIGDGVLDHEINSDWSSGVTKESVEKEAAYRAQAGLGRRFLRLIRRTIWWIR